MLTLGRGLYHITKLLIIIMCVLMCITGCGKTRNVASHTEKMKWGYEAENGPDVWAQLNPEYILCAEGMHQSPIDLVNPTLAELPPIPHDYSPTSMNIRNTGHTIEVVCPEGNWIEVDGTRYELLQFHFHAPSEHTVAGKPFDMEAHFVHKSEDGTLAVVGLLIESGRHKDAFDPIWSHLPTVPGETQRIENVTEDGSLIVDPRLMFAPNDQVEDMAPSRFGDYYRYDGSLTTPPCSESVKWIMLTTPIEMSEAQIAAFKAIFNGNNRPVQPLNGRKLLVNSTGDE